MDGTPDITQILKALASQKTPASNQSTPAPQPQSQLPPPAVPQNYPGAYPTATPPTGLQSGFTLPQPTNTGSVDLSSIKPVSTGSVSISDAIAKARGFAAEKGVAYDGRVSTGPREDPRLAGRSSYRPRSRSRSRSPPRRDYRDNYNPYRDERRDDSRRGASYVRDRSRSPAPRGRDTFSPARNYGGRSPPSRGADENSETIFIESTLVGLVIGRQGENLRRIEQDTGTRIQFVTGPESGGAQRSCKISGNLRARADAKREIYRIIDENGGNIPKDGGISTRGNRIATPVAQTKPGHQPALREGENSIQIMVPDKTVGLIIGRGGETIRDLQDKSGCHINIVGENKSINGLRPVNLIGSVAAANRAQQLIQEVVESDTKNTAAANANATGREPTAYGVDDGKINETIQVPSEAVGMIIGKGGETIKDMQNQTGCKINVSQPSGADHEREIGLVGTRNAIEAAKRAIWEKVDTVIQREKNGGQGGRRGGGGRLNFDDDQYGDRYSQQQQPYGQYTSQAGAPQTQQAVPAGGDPATLADPYAAYGGYANYYAMWHAWNSQQGQGQGEQQRPPGA
ncbi:hypothetical protein M501DRAFT_1015782 [Patellaria atrata CBS 101060]|uniref:K Homology domain-containing protein n=1 Tax=Patellaria atrata CBS 101060 TaxID=1346257 RepID=A0A9P4SDN5_9PEZI|nr:hypothetical protein M501DRAFT_1015782 [Patellaria atrata CBS 101060]